MLVVLAVAVVVMAHVVPAGADNITMWDGYGPLGLGPGGEWAEVEPDCFPGWGWDLIGVAATAPAEPGDPWQITFAGGYNFAAGNGDIESGDIFLAFSEDGPLDNPGDSGSWGYDMVLDMDWSGDMPSGSPIPFNIIDISSDLVDLLLVGESINHPWADPYRWSSGGTVVGSGSASFQVYDNAAELEAAFPGDFEGANSLIGDVTLYTLSFEFSPQEDSVLWTHFTMECGNDILLGRTEFPAVPEPSTISLLFMGCLGLVLRKRPRV